MMYVQKRTKWGNYNMEEKSGWQYHTKDFQTMPSRSRSPWRPGTTGDYTNTQEASLTQETDARGEASTPGGRRPRSNMCGKRHQQDREVPERPMIQHREAWVEREDKEKKLGRERESAGPTCSFRVSLPVYIMYTNSTGIIRAPTQLFPHKFSFGQWL